MKIIKFFFKTILSIIVTAIVVAGVSVAFLYKNNNVPDYYKDDSKTYDIQNSIIAGLDKYLASPEKKELDIEITDEDLIYLIRDNIDKEIHGNDTFPSEIEYKGAWVTIKNDVLSIQASVKNNKFVTFHSRVLLDFKISSDVNDITLKLKEVSVGNFRMSWMYGVANQIVRMATGQTLDELINDATSEYDFLEYNNRTIKVNKSKMVKYLNENNNSENSKLINELLDVVIAENLLNIEFNNNVKSSINLEKIAKDADKNIVNQINNDQELEKVLNAKVNSVLIGAVLSKDEINLHLDLITLNRMIEYKFRDISGNTQEITIGNEVKKTYILKIESPYITSNDDAMIINMRVLFFEKGQNEESGFVTLLQLASKIGIEDIDGDGKKDDLTIQFNKLAIGDLSIDGLIPHIATLINDVSIIKDDKFIISNFTDYFMDSVKLGELQENIKISNDSIILSFTPNAGSSELLEDVNEVIKDVLNDIDNQGIDFSAITNGTATVEDIDKIIADIDKLDEDAQKKLLDDMADKINDLWAADPIKYPEGQTIEDLINLYTN